MAAFDDKGSIEALEQQILSRVDYLDKGLAGKLAVLVSDVNNKLKAGNFKNRTGNLRRSMSAQLIDNTLTVSMLNYGYFLSFGVNGKNRSNAFGITAEVGEAFGLPEGYKFGAQSSKNVWGIDPRRFYPVNIEEELINILNEEQ
jgi:hypothetical protein